MRVDISLKYLEKSEFIDNVLDKNVKKIERRVKIFKRDVPVHISAHIEKNPHREQYFCRVQIYLPSKVLKADEKGENFSVVVNKTFAALSRQVDKFKHKLEGSLRRGRIKTGSLDEE